MAIPGASSAIAVTETHPQQAGEAAVWQTARLVQITPLTPRIKSFVLELAQPFVFRAGQHVDLRLSAPDGYQAMRGYSIASAPSANGRIELAIELMESGEVSPFFHEVVAVGDDIELRGPLGGHFVWGPEDGGPLLLIGGGSGVAPLMAMLRQRLDGKVPVPTVLLLASRTLEDVLYRAELLAMEAEAPGFALRLALSRGAAVRGVDYARRLDTAMLKDVLNLLPETPRHVFICGANGFVNTAADAALAAGLDAARVRTERYGG